jgi:RNA polymerase sigma-70 factor (ECF subfamily)
LNSKEAEHIIDLVNRCKKGDKPSQYRLYMMYADAMFAICKRFTVNKPDAEEVLQDAFVKAFSKIKKLKDERNFGTWLKRITINENINFIRKKKICFEELPENLSTSVETNDSIFEADEETIKNAIEGLPDGCRVIFNLYLMENHKHKEIARMLEISESTSKSQYQRAKQLLKEKLTRALNERSI